MIFANIVFLLVLGVSSTMSEHLRGLNVENSVLTRFNNWIEEHNFHIFNEDHLVHVFENWVSNDKFIDQTNSQGLSFKLGHNAYSGYSFDEFRQFMGFDFNRNLISSLKSNNSMAPIEVSVPSSVDWRSQGVVNTIKDQGQCGSCWSFSTIQALESASAIKYGKLYTLSEQELVDCDNLSNGGRDHGCNGGLMDNAFTWIGKNNGVCSGTDYPYVSGVTKTSGTCQKTCKNQPNTDVIKYVDITVNSDSAMMSALAQQPVSIAIEADQRTFQLYSSGVFTGECGTNIDHGVGLVGYTADYYILRNSWGESWGVNGYMMIGKGNDPETGKPYNGGAGQCGLLTTGSYPIV